MSPCSGERHQHTRPWRRATSPYSFWIWLAVLGSNVQAAEAQDMSGKQARRSPWQGQRQATSSYEAQAFALGSDHGTMRSIVAPQVDAKVTMEYEKMQFHSMKRLCTYLQ